MEQDESNKRIPPAVEDDVERTYEDPVKPVQRSWNKDMTLLIVALAAIFLVVIVVAWLAFS